MMKVKIIKNVTFSALCFAFLLLSFMRHFFAPQDNFKPIKSSSEFIGDLAEKSAITEDVTILAIDNTQEGQSDSEF